MRIEGTPSLGPVRDTPAYRAPLSTPSPVLLSAEPRLEVYNRQAMQRSETISRDIDRAVERARPVDAPPATPLADAGVGVSQSATDGISKAAELTRPVGRISRLLSRAGPAVGLISGGLQAILGVETVRAGRVVEGVATATAGGASLASGAGVVLGAVRFSGVAGGAGAIIEGGRDVVLGLREGNAEKTTLGGLKSLAGGVAVAGAVTANPVLAVAGGAAYLGIVAVENRGVIGEAASATGRLVSRGAGAALSSVRGFFGGGS